MDPESVQMGERLVRARAPRSQVCLEVHVGAGRGSYQQVSNMEMVGKGCEI